MQANLCNLGLLNTLRALVSRPYIWLGDTCISWGCYNKHIIVIAVLTVYLPGTVLNSVHILTYLIIFLN